MDWIFPLLAALFVLSGTGLMYYLTYSFRNTVKSSQSRSEKLNKEIEKVVNNSENLNKQILKTNDDIKKITEDLKTTSGEIKELNQDVKKITTNTNSLTEESILLTKKVKDLSQIIKNIQTGGDVYLTVEPHSTYVNDEWIFNFILRVK